MSTVVAFKLKALGSPSDSDKSHAHYCIGHPFRQGDVPSGQTLTTPDAFLQVTVKNRFPDGSIRFAILSGKADLSPVGGLVNGWKTITLSTSVAGAPPPPLVATSLKSVLTSAVFGAGTFGSATFSGADLDSPFITWVNGNRMSSWIYKKQIGSDPHLTAWLEVRMWDSLQLEILPWVENATLSVAGPTSKQATYTFAFNGTQRFSGSIDLPARCRTPLLSGSSVSYWHGGTQIDVAVQHNRTYLESTGAVPKYMATLAATHPVVQALPTTFSPLQKGSLTDTMGEEGAADTIGLLPTADMAYLICPDAADKVWKAVQFNAYSAGRYPIHFRDEKTGRVLIYGNYWQRCLPQNGLQMGFGGGASAWGDYCPSATGTPGPRFTWSHHPRLNYLAYLTSGRWHYMDGLQLMMGSVYMSPSTNSRNQSQGVVRPESDSFQPRGAGWVYATMAATIYSTPDDEVPAIRDQFLAQAGFTFLDLRSRYCRAGTNPLGAINGLPDHAGSGVWAGSLWQQDFIQQGLGFMRGMNLPLSDAARSDLVQFFEWIGKSVPGRLGAHDDPNSFFFAHAQDYYLATRPTDTPQQPWEETNPPFYNNWGEAYTATFTKLLPSLGPRTADSAIKTRLDGTGYLAILVGALASCRQFGIPGAEAAWTRLTAAPNWQACVNDYTTINPNFALLPTSALVVAPAPSPTAPTPPPPAPPVDPSGRGPTIRMRLPAGFAANSLIVGMPGNGVLGSQVPTTGANGPSILYSCLDLPADANAEVRVVPVDRPAGLTSLRIFPNGAVEAEGPKGTYKLGFHVYREGGLVEGTATATIHIDTTPARNARHRVHSRRR